MIGALFGRVGFTLFVAALWLDYWPVTAVMLVLAFVLLPRSRWHEG